LAVAVAVVVWILTEHMNVGETGDIDKWAIPRASNTGCHQ